MNCRQIIYSSITCCLVFVGFANVASAQSKDRESPTPLTSNKVSSRIYVDNKNETFYYSFEAGPGEIIATLNVDPERRGTNQVVVDFLLPETENNLATLGVFTSLKSQQQARRFTLSRRQTVIMKVWITTANDDEGSYQVLLSGAVKIGQEDASSKPKAVRDDAADALQLAPYNPSCLPKQGTLIVKMKDGSKKIIDLSGAETITLVP